MGSAANISFSASPGGDEEESVRVLIDKLEHGIPPPVGFEPNIPLLVNMATNFSSGATEFDIQLREKLTEYFVNVFQN